MSKTSRIFAVWLALGPFAATAVECDGIAAKVGSEVILRSDVVSEMQRLRAPSEAYDNILENIIDRKLILKAAGESKMTMQEWIVENRIREIIQKSFGGDRNRLMETLAREKISYPEWYKRMKDDLIVNAMRYQVVDKNVDASPAAMRKEYAEHPDRYTTGSKISVSIILLKPEDADKRETINAELREKPFAEIAKKYSSDSHAAEGGKWTDVEPAEVFNPQVCDEIARMPKGTVSHWIEIQGWSYLLKKDSAATGQAMTFEDAFDKIEENVKEEAARTAYAAWIKRLRAETFIKKY